MRKTILLFLFIGLLFVAAGSSLSRWNPPLQVDAASTPPELRVLGFNTFLAGSPASLRIISYDPSSGRGIANVPVSLTLELGGDKPPLPLLHGNTNAQGTLDAQFKIPSGLQGSGVLRIKSPMVAGDDLQAPVTIRKEQKLYLTTDKPLYQPGQTVHVRLLALREPDLIPIAQQSVTLEIEDAKGNKVFKKVTPSSRFGVVSATFELASEVNMGEYHVKAYLDSEVSQKSFTVKRYVLPKFKVVVKTDKSYYLPSEKIHGTVQADYFFGKPVSGAKIAVKLSTFDVSEHELAVIDGTTHADGSFTFDSTLPSQFVGRPLDQGAAPLSILAEVTDTANHKESGPLALKVVSSPLKAEIFPESGRLEPGLENLVYVVTSYPDGSPAACDLSVTLGKKVLKAKTDATGFGSFSYTPPPIAIGPAPVNRWRGQVAYVPPPPTVAVQISAHDSRGNTAQLTPSLTQTAGQESVLLRTDKALYRVGDTLNAEIFSTRKAGSVYVDFVRNGQTVLTQSVDLNAGRGQLHMDLASDLSGAMTVNAYEIAASQDVIRDTRQIFVQPARDLMVDVRMDRSTYLPGQDAKLTFMVKDKQGAPRLAVLGVDIVDESLFALAEKEPGLERVYFLLEREMMEARYEVHGFQVADAVKDPRNVDSPSRQNLSRALFSQAPTPAAFTCRVDSFDTRLRLLADRMQRVQQAVYVYRQKHRTYPASMDDLVTDRLVGADAIRDVWGHNFRIRMQSGNALVYSVGPDGKNGTADDVSFQDVYQIVYANNGFAMAGEDRDVVRGGAGGGGIMRARAATEGAMAPMAAPAAAMKAAGQAESLDARKKDKSESGAPTRVREFFPETLYSNPQVITDESGRASVTVPMADSITTWRLGAFASSLNGEMGNGEGSMRVFQDFFVDIDLPVSLTQDDEISVPVAVYNYLPQAQDVTLSLDKDTWFQLQDEPKRNLHLAKNEVSVVYFKLRAQQPGTHRLTVKAQGSKMADAVRRSVDIVPNGQSFETVLSDRLAGNVTRHLVLPQDAIAGASKILLTVYPGIFAQVVEGMDNIFRMPGGCFEQTSSTTYPNVLVLDYLKRVRKITPEIHMKADGFINTGYQRLLTFEVKGGGFSVFGQVPANPILTAYGVMEFADMAKVHEIDPTLVNRTRSWLLAQQQNDGSWGAGKEGFYAEGWSNVPNSSLVSTAYITWALLETGEKGPGVQKAVAYIKEHLQQAEDPYTAALVANALVVGAPQDPMTQKALAILASMRVEDKDVVYWRTKIATAAFGTGQAGDIETTALATLALMGSDRYTSDINKAITYLVRSKDASGTWQSTQATILAMKALIRSIDKASEKADASVAVSLNGKPASSFKITRADSDVFRQIDLTSLAKTGENTVDLQFSGQGNCMYKIVGEYYRPWKGAIEPPEEPLALDVSYDRTHLAMNDTAVCSVKVQNKTTRTANMVMLDVGVPPGFDVNTSDLEALVAKRTIEKFSSTGRQVIIYLEKIDPSANLAFSFHMKARFPIRALAPRSRAYEYYNPKREALASPIKMEVTPRH